MTAGTVLLMDPATWRVLVDKHGWADLDAMGTLAAVEVETADGPKVWSRIVTIACQSIDIFDAAVHCATTLEGQTGHTIEVLDHDGSLPSYAPAVWCVEEGATGYYLEGMAPDPDVGWFCVDRETLEEVRSFLVGLGFTPDQIERPTRQDLAA